PATSWPARAPARSSRRPRSSRSRSSTRTRSGSSSPETARERAAAAGLQDRRWPSRRLRGRLAGCRVAAPPAVRVHGRGLDRLRGERLRLDPRVRRTRHAEGGRPRLLRVAGARRHGPRPGALDRGLHDARPHAIPDDMNDAEERFAERLAEDLDRVLGVGLAIDDIELEVGDRAAHVKATLLIGEKVETIEAWGRDVLSLYRPIIERAAELRLAAAFWRMVGPA